MRSHREVQRTVAISMGLLLSPWRDRNDKQAMTLLETIWKKFLVHVVDVAIVSVLFYYLLVLIKGTRAVQVLTGVVLLFLATFVAQNILHLPTLSWLLTKFWLAGVVMLVVVFQPEIRSFLAELGSQRLGRSLMPQEITFLNELISAVREASKQHMGMLIVLEQETGLRNFIETGTRIEGLVSRELFLTLFHPPTILHDGAVIIRGNHVVAAGCVLPLSNDPTLSKILGTRHRAAVGISEISDALVIVVSEETGIISLAQNGHLERDLSPEALQEKLTRIYQARAPRLFRTLGSPVGNSEHA